MNKEALMGSLKRLMKSDEWMEMLRLPMIEQESTVPPVCYYEETPGRRRGREESMYL
jgi:hypothetical protein